MERDATEHSHVNWVWSTCLMSSNTAPELGAMYIQYLATYMLYRIKNTHSRNVDLAIYILATLCEKEDHKHVVISINKTDFEDKANFPNPSYEHAYNKI